MFSEVETLVKERLQQGATKIRDRYLNKPFPKSNVAIAEVHLNNEILFCVGGTSKGGKNSPIPKPKSKSEGGQFEPSQDSRTARVMDTDAEYKVLSALGDVLDRYYSLQVEGKVYLYTELEPCQSCTHIIKQFEQKFPNIEVKLFWDHPYLPN